MEHVSVHPARALLAAVGTACYAVWLALPHLLSPLLPTAQQEPASYRQKLRDSYAHLYRSDNVLALWVLTASAALLVAVAIYISYSA